MIAKLSLVRRILALLGITALVFSGISVVGQDEAAASHSDPAVIAHRGSSGIAPENTLAAVRIAMEQKADWFEIDVQLTADGELILFHDTTLERTTNAEEVFPDRAPWVVGDFTLAELKQLDAGSWFAPEFAGEEIPTLDELLDLISPRIGFLLEVKDPALYPGIEQQIADTLAARRGYLSAAQRTDRIVVQSFDHESMFLYSKIQPDTPVGLLFSQRPTDDELVAASEFALEINPNFRLVDKELLDRVHELGMRMSVYTVNSGRDMRSMIDLGVDGIITDFPAVLIDLLRREH